MRSTVPFRPASGVGFSNRETPTRQPPTGFAPTARPSPPACGLPGDATPPPPADLQGACPRPPPNATDPPVALHAGWATAVPPRAALPAGPTIRPEPVAAIARDRRRGPSLPTA